MSRLFGSKCICPEYDAKQLKLLCFSPHSCFHGPRLIRRQPLPTRPVGSHHRRHDPPRARRTRPSFPRLRSRRHTTSRATRGESSSIISIWSKTLTKMFACHSFTTASPVEQSALQGRHRATQFSVAGT